MTFRKSGYSHGDRPCHSSGMARMGSTAPIDNRRGNRSDLAIFPAPGFPVISRIETLTGKYRPNSAAEFPGSLTEVPGSSGNGNYGIGN
jgi:hypothetical protein